jgi:shikimate dehydrogenase
VCKAFTTSDLAVAIAGIRALGIRGCGVSMPYKEACIELVGRGGRLGGGDRISEHDREHRRAAARLQHRLPGRLPGPGGPRPRRARQRGHGKAVVAALRDAGFHAGTVVARNPRTGAALAERYGYPPGGRGWRQPAQLLVNATPVGMSGGPAADDLPVAPEVVDAAETVLDVVAAQALTPLVRRARAQASRSSPVPRSLRCRPWNSSSSTEASAPATTRSVAPQRSPARRPTPGAAVRAEHFHAVSSGPAGVSGSGDQGRSEFTVSPTVGGCRAGSR